MLDNMLDDIIKTSKSGHTFTSDMDMVGSILSDVSERWGVIAVQGYVDGYLRGLKLTTEARGDNE